MAEIKLAIYLMLVF